MNVENQVLEKLTQIEGKIDNLEGRFDNLENRTSRVEMLIENEIVPNISLLAESHVNLERKLKVAQETESERLQRDIRIRKLEFDMETVKERVDHLYNVESSNK